MLIPGQILHLLIQMKTGDRDGNPKISYSSAVFTFSFLIQRYLTVWSFEPEFVNVDECFSFHVRTGYKNNMH